MMMLGSVCAKDAFVCGRIEENPLCHFNHSMVMPIPPFRPRKWVNRLFIENCRDTVEAIDSGCCGMAGSLAYEKEHYAISMATGEP